MASERHHTTSVHAHRASGARRRNPRKGESRAAGRTAWGAAVGCAAFGLASLAGGCAPSTVAMPAAANPPSLGTEPVGPTAPPPAATASPTDGQRVRPIGGQQLGQASYYGPEFTGRRMANGRRFDPRSTSVAHRTLPFGTKVVVTHLGNGRSATATVEDRGPFVRGRVIDLSPRLAEHLGMIVQGVAPVSVTPVELAEAPD
jgi:peptidoglycan lytic transglycosylase